MALNRLSTMLADERGSVATLFAVLLPVLLGFAALGIETGFWFSERQRAQIASDTAAYSALVAYAGGSSVGDASTRGVAMARVSGFTGSDQAITITITPASGSRGAYSTATISETVPLFLTRLFLNSEVLPIQVRSHAALDAVAAPANCVMALSDNSSRAIQIASSVQVTLKNCVASANSSTNDSIWLEGQAKLTADCISTPGGVNWNGSAVLTLNACTRTNYPRVKQTDPYVGSPFWGSSDIPSPTTFIDASISQGRYGPGMPGGATLKPGKYGKQVEIAGDVTFEPGIYYFTNGFRATSGGKINGTGVTFFLDQTKTIDVAQSVPWRISAPTSGPTKGIAIMGDPTKTNNSDVRLIGIMGNVEGLVYFPNQRLLTENGPNGSPARCTTVVARLIDIRGSGTINNDCSNASGGSSSSSGKVRLVQAPPT